MYILILMFSLIIVYVILVFIGTAFTQIMLNFFNPTPTYTTRAYVWNYWYNT